VNVGFAKLQVLGDLHMSETAYGLGAGIFFIGYVLCGVPSNLMLYKVGARRWLTLLMVVWGIRSTSLMFIRDANEFYLIRLLIGASEADSSPGSLSDSFLAVLQANCYYSRAIATAPVNRSLRFELSFEHIAIRFRHV
jgi:MFS family permease